MNRQLIGHLINFFRELIQSQKTLQCIRKQLSTLKFQPTSMFRKIAGCSQSITIKMMNEYVKGKISCNQKDLYQIFQKFDHKRQGHIAKEDFCRQLQPIQKKKCRTKGKIIITYEAQNKFLYYLSTIIKSSRVIDVWRKEISIFEPYRIFEALDINMDGKIGPEELGKFFFRFAETLCIGGARFLYQILLRRHYNEVNLEVFCQNLNPRQFGGYRNFQRQLKLQKEMELGQKLKKQQQAAEAQRNFHKQLNNQKVVELVHKEASLLREKELEDKIKNELQVYRDLKFITRKKYHPQLTYQQFLRMEKQNIDRTNLEKQLMLEQALRKQEKYHQSLLNVDVVRQVQAFERSKIQRLPFMTIKNRIQSDSKTFQNADLQNRIKKHMMERMNNLGKTPISRMASFKNESSSFYR